MTRITVFVALLAFLLPPAYVLISRSLETPVNTQSTPAGRPVGELLYFYSPS